MRVEILKGLTPVVVEGATRVLVAGDDGTPVAVASEWTPGTVIVAHGRDRDFNEVLRRLGIDRTLIVTRFHPDPAAEVLGR